MEHSRERERETERLLPCPFCGADLEYEEHVCRAVKGRPILRLWAHPSGKCILAGMEVPKEDHEAWNRRAEPAMRCRDCRHDGLLSCPLVSIEQQTLVFLNHDPNWFCGDWEAKEAEG